MLSRSPSLSVENGRSARTNLRASVGDGTGHALMVGCGETYLAAFALAIGLGEVSAGLVSSVPLLAGGFTQLISPHGVRWLGGEKRWVILCASIQACAFVPLILAALYGSITLPVLLVVMSVYWAAGLSTGPAWNTWMESIVPPRVRPRYFAKRTRTCQLATFAAFLSGGMLLHVASQNGQTLTGFAILFLIAGCFRASSVFWLARHQTKPAPASSGAAPTRSIAGTIDSAGLHGVRLIVYLVVVQGMVQISSPYFAPFMLEELQFSYAEFVSLLAVAYLSKVVALSWWARVAKRHGAKKLLWIGGVGLVPLSSLWIVSQNVWWLVAVQLASGVAWAAYELGFFLMFFDSLPVAKRTRMLTIYNLANTSAWCCGAMLGGAILTTMGTDRSVYLLLFGLSSLGRLLALTLLPGLNTSKLPQLRIRFSGMSVRPNAASLDSPVMPGLRKRA